MYQRCHNRQVGFHEALYLYLNCFLSFGFLFLVPPCPFYSSLLFVLFVVVSSLPYCFLSFLVPSCPSSSLPYSLFAFPIPSLPLFSFLFLSMLSFLFLPFPLSLFSNLFSFFPFFPLFYSFVFFVFFFPSFLILPPFAKRCCCTRTSEPKQGD